MKLATIRTSAGNVAVRIDGEVAVEVGAPDVGMLLADPAWRERAAAADGHRHDLGSVDYAPLVPNPSKIFCVGLNYQSHILEMGRQLPEYPTLFAKFPDALTGARDELTLPSASDRVDWEVELGVVLGTTLRRGNTDQAAAAIAGYTVINDISMRDYQRRTVQWLQGKTFESSTPVGPWLVTPDEVNDAAALEVRCEVDGEVMQRSNTSDLLFRPADVAAYISEIITLRPGDLIASGTPGGVGDARDPQRYLQPGQTVRTVVEGLGECVNVCAKEAA